MRAVHEDFTGLVHQLKATLLNDDNPALPRGELQELVTEAAVALIEYKGLARESAVAVEGCRAEMQAKKREVDERHLQLQNLLYEKDHLQRTIQTLRDFPLKELAKMEREEGVPLLPGLTEGAEGEGRLLSMEEHRQNMETLRTEKETRLRLHQEHAAAQTKRAALAEELNKLRETLGTTLPRQIEELDALCRGIQERMPDIPVAVPFGGFSVDDLRALPQALFILLGRLHAYAQAFDPEESQVSVSIISCAQQEWALLPPSLVVVGTDAARSVGKQAGISRMEVEGEEGEEGGSGTAVVTVVDTRAIKLEFSPLKGEGGVEEEGEKEGEKDVLFFYFAVGTRELLVSAPGRHPFALVNLLPGDTGGVSPSSSSSSSSSTAPSSSPSTFSSTSLKSSKKRRTSTTKKTSGSINNNNSTAGHPMAFMWLSWLGGTSPFPSHLMDLGAAYTSTCIFNRLRVRLRAQRLLDKVFKNLNLNPREAGKDGGMGGGAGGGWIVTSFVEASLGAVLGEEEEGREGGIGGDPFAEVSCGVQGAEGGGEGRRDEEEAMVNAGITVEEDSGEGGKNLKEGNGGEMASSRQQQGSASGGGGGGGGGARTHGNGPEHAISKLL